MAGYSGMWKQRAYHDPPPFRFEIDPAHGALDTPDQNAFTYDAPPLIEVSDVGEFPGMEIFAPLPGVTLDRTPVTHDGRPHPVRETEQQMQADSQVAHAENFGASRAAEFVPAPMDFWDERQVHTVVEGFGSEATTVNTVALQRGLNGLAENNPDGFRKGETQLWRHDRKFAVGERHHDERPVTLNTPYLPTNVPPPPPDKANPYMSPFGSLARPITRYFQRPEIRRDPKGISEGITTDGMGDYSAPLGSEWVM